MQKVQKKVWQLIDDDSAQYVSYLDPAAGTTGKVFDFAQVTALPDGYVISKEVVDVGAYTDADIEDTLGIHQIASAIRFRTRSRKRFPAL